MNPVILVTVKEDVVEFQGHHVPLNLEGSGDVEGTGVISHDRSGTTSKKFPTYSSSDFFPSSSNTPNIYITSILPRRSLGLNPNH